MSDEPIETSEQRRERYLRLARAAADAAAKTPLAGPREMYLQLAHSWTAMAEDGATAPHDCAASEAHAGDRRPSPSLNG